MKKKSVSSLSEIPAVNEYLQRIGAEPRSLLTAVVREMNGKYWKDIAVIKFSRNGAVDAPESWAPSENEVTRIIAQFDEYEFPTQQTIKGLTNLPEAIANAEPENIFKFYDTEGSIIMLQLRRDGKDGAKHRFHGISCWLVNTGPCFQ